MAAEPDQLAMEVGAGPVPAPYPIAGPFQPPCGDLGPYVLGALHGRQPQDVTWSSSATGPHADGPHQWADAKAEVAFVWAVDGRPIHPLPIEARCKNCGNP